MTHVHAEHKSELDELVITAQESAQPELRFTNPVSRITEFDIKSINSVTVEDFLKYEPGLIVRRRYIGDPSGTLGIRGSNMFQTARSMVFADGLPLHYHLQTRWSGSPRWSLVAPEETLAVETVYGPFSARYSGNAMGGVVNITTRYPEKFEFSAETSSFLQDFEFLGDDDYYFGHKEFISIGNKFEDFSVYLFHQHLENKSQPMSFFNPERTSPDTGTPVTGAFVTPDEFGNLSVYFGDSGSEEITSDLSKLKLAYNPGDWFTSLTLAYESRNRDADNAKTYLRDLAGNPVFRGDHTFNSILFDTDGRFGNLFRIAFEERETRLIGGKLSGPLVKTGWDMTLNFSVFDVIKDLRLRSDENPVDPSFDGSGRIREFDDTGWQTFDIQLGTDHLFERDDMHLTVGYHYDHYQLKVAEFTAIGDFKQGVKGTLRNNNPSAGRTIIHAGFAEFGWHFYPMWDVILGGRYEAWQGKDGQKGSDRFDDRHEARFSPKLALGFTPDGPWSYRYSLAKAYRFPLIEELFENEEDALGSTLANAKLKPEAGLHHNLSIKRNILGGSLSLNLYYETINDVIFNQRDLNSNITTFLNINEVTTKGAELNYRQHSLFKLPLDLRFNIAYTDAKITKNDANPSTVGKQFPRLPDWRINVLTTYQITKNWDFSTGIRYASNSHGQLDNTDTAEGVFGAQDAYTFIDLKTTYQLNKALELSAGIENINNDTAFVFHPWPQRTGYLTVSINL